MSCGPRMSLQKRDASPFLIGEPEVARGRNDDAPLPVRAVAHQVRIKLGFAFTPLEVVPI